MKTLNGALETLENDSELTKQLKVYTASYEKDCLSEAEKLLKKAKKLLRGSKKISEKLDSIDDLRPVGLDTNTGEISIPIPTIFIPASQSSSRNCINNIEPDINRTATSSEIRGLPFLLSHITLSLGAAFSMMGNNRIDNQPAED